MRPCALPDAKLSVRRIKTGIKREGPETSKSTMGLEHSKVSMPCVLELMREPSGEGRSRHLPLALVTLP